MTERSEFATGWGVVVASAAGFGLCLSGLPYYTMGVFVEPLQKTFGWSTPAIQGGLTVMLLANIITLPVAAWLADRFGGRPVALASVALFGLAFMFLGALNQSLPVYYLHWLLLSVTGAGTLTVIWTKGISGYFLRARGLALGLAVTGTGVTAVLAPVLTNLLIEKLGWRGAYEVLGSLPLVLALPLVWFLFHERPATKGLGNAETQPGKATGTGTLIFADWRFWLIGTAFLLISTAASGAIPNMVKLLRQHDFTPEKASRVASLAGLFVLFGRVACGALLDRVKAAAVAALFFIPAGVACLLLRATHLNTLTVGVAAGSIGLAVGAELNLLPYLASRYFGVERVGMALGLLSMFFYLGSAIGPWEFSWLSERYGNYDTSLLAAAGGLAAGSLLLLLLGPYPAGDPAKCKSLEALERVGALSQNP